MMIGRMNNPVDLTGFPGRYPLEAVAALGMGA